MQELMHNLGQALRPVSRILASIFRYWLPIGIIVVWAVVTLSSNPMSMLYYFEHAGLDIWRWLVCIFGGLVLFFRVRSEYQPFTGQAIHHLQRRMPGDPIRQGEVLWADDFQLGAMFFNASAQVAGTLFFLLGLYILLTHTVLAIYLLIASSVGMIAEARWYQQAMDEEEVRLRRQQRQYEQNK